MDRLERAFGSAGARPSTGARPAAGLPDGDIGSAEEVADHDGAETGPSDANGGGGWVPERPASWGRLAAHEWGSGTGSAGAGVRRDACSDPEPDRDVRGGDIGGDGGGDRGGDGGSGIGGTEGRDLEGGPAPARRRRWHGLGRRLRRPARPSADGLLLVVSPQAVAALVAVACLALLLGGCQLWRSKPVEERVPGAPALATQPSAAPAPGTGAEGGSGAGAAPSVAPVTPSMAPPAQVAPPEQGAMPEQAMPPAQGAAPVAGSPIVVVHVAGRVREPGVVRLPSGARIGDAVTAAGGPAGGADLAAVNLARPVLDGEQVYVPEEGAQPPAAMAPGRGATGTAGPAASGAGGTLPAPAADDPGAGEPEDPVDLNTATLDQLQELPGVGPVLAQRILEWRVQHGRFSMVEELGEISGIGERTLAELTPRVRV